VRTHVLALSFVLFTVAAGLVVAPGLALPETYGGRLVGAIWPLTPPQIGQYAATVAGLVIMLWLGRHITRTSALVVAIPAVALLLLSHTRTALLGLIGGLVVAIVSQVTTSARAHHDRARHRGGRAGGGRRDPDVVPARAERPHRADRPGEGVGRVAGRASHAQ
jgi:hypothetical protein